MKRYFIETVANVKLNFAYIYVYDDSQKSVTYFSTAYKIKRESYFGIEYLEKNKNIKEVSESYIEKVLVESELLR